MRTREEIQLGILEKIFVLTHKKIDSPDEELVDSGILTSITLAELAVELENLFHIRFPFIEVNRENFATPSRICTLVQQKMAHAL